ncbi:MAG TPA: tetratricopeptide repeat protein [Stellaceae bacterium]|nr:tetratricopeptide repeat protein [Stellaceae bacterium]
MSETLGRIEALINQGIAAQQAEHYADAERAYRSALQLDPTHPRALALLGMLAGFAGQFQMAIDLFLRSLRRDPMNADLYHDLGETYRQIGDVGKALPAFNRAIELRPSHLEAYRGAADAAIEAAARSEMQGRAAQAAELRRMAAKYLMNLGARQYQLRQKASETSFRDAIALDPGAADAFYSLGSLLHELSCPTEAVAMLRRAVELNPGDAEAHCNLGSAYYPLGKWPEMEAAFTAALARNPNMRLASQGLVSTRLGRLLYDDASTVEDIFAAHRGWGESAAAAATEKPAPWANTREPERRLRIAYVSGDLFGHPVAYFLLPLLAHHDPRAVEIFGYAELPRTDATTENIRRLCAQWRETNALDDAALRAQLRADRIDIVIDLAGHTARNRLQALAVKAAPVTATWLGYPTTTGLQTIDWRITDAIADPPGAERVHTEKLWRMPDGFLCYAPQTPTPEVAPPSSERSGIVTFGSFNTPMKLSNATVESWAAILHALPEARLLLKAGLFNDSGLRDTTRERFIAKGIAPERIALRGFIADPVAHLTSYAEIDIGLDPFPYNGTTTTCEALWMGVPVVTLIGDRHAGRVGLDLLSRIGLAELAAPDIDAYVALAVALGRDAQRRAQLRGGLRQRMQAAPLCDPARFARSFEAALRQMWREWCAP